jgi:excinuclease ABC subunit C
VQRIRDEVHRYALAYHRALRGGQFKRSALEEIPGVGPATARTLLKAFGSVRKLRDAGVEEIAAVVPRSVAERVVGGLGGGGRLE